MLKFNYNLINFPPNGRLQFHQLNYDTPPFSRKRLREKLHLFLLDLHIIKKKTQ